MLKINLILFMLAMTLGSGIASFAANAGYSCQGCSDTTKDEVATRLIYNRHLLKSVSSLRRMPLANGDWVPQGLTKHNDLIYVSYYYKDKNGNNNNNKTPSIVVEYNYKTYKTQKIWYLYKQKSNGSISGAYYHHVAGLVVLDDKIIITDGSKFHHFPKYKAKKIFSMYGTTYYQSVRTKSYSPDTGVFNTNHSFASISKDYLGNSIIWTGHFAKSSQFTTLNGYKITNGTAEIKPIYQFIVPWTVYRLQGATLLSSSSSTFKFFVARSYGDKSSYGYTLTFRKSDNIMTSKSFMWGSSKMTYIGPAGMENVHATKDGVWSISESGAKYYRNKWSQYFPFIYRIRKSTLK